MGNANASLTDNELEFGELAYKAKLSILEKRLQILEPRNSEISAVDVD